MEYQTSESTCAGWKLMLSELEELEAVEDGTLLLEEDKTDDELLELDDEDPGAPPQLASPAEINSINGAVTL